MSGSRRPPESLFQRPTPLDMAGALDLVVTRPRATLGDTGRPPALRSSRLEASASRLAMTGMSSHQKSFRAMLIRQEDEVLRQRSRLRQARERLAESFVRNRALSILRRRESLARRQRMRKG